jgi:hypothetical protein
MPALLTIVRVRLLVQRGRHDRYDRVWEREDSWWVWEEPSAVAGRWCVQVCSG